MRSDESFRPDIFFSLQAEDHIRRFVALTKRAQSTAANYIPIVHWILSVTFTPRDSGLTHRMGPHFVLHAIDASELKDDAVVRLRNGVDVAVRLPQDLRAVDRIGFDMVDRYFVIPDRPGYSDPPKLL